MSDNSGGIFDSATLTTIVKWTVTILIMGFITQFGRKLANYIIDKAARVRKRRELREIGGVKNPEPAPGTGHEPDIAIGPVVEKAHYKREKKAAKALEKLVKKKI